MTLDELLAPHSEQEFLGDVLGKSALYLKGSEGRFCKLVSWPILNHLLEYGGLAYPRLRLISAGSELSEHDYLATGPNGYCRPIVEGLCSALRDGATLAVEGFQELHEPVDAFCQSLELRLGVPVAADLYASCQAGVCGTLRWNDHEVIALQVEGSKAWRLHCPSTRNPTAMSPPPEPEGDAAWDGVLHSGDLLYLPRGWWFIDSPLDEPSLFLAITFRLPTGVDILRRLVIKTEGNALLREYCPCYGDPVRQSMFVALVQREVSEAARQPGILLGLLKEIRAGAAPRIRFDLPNGTGRNQPLPRSGAMVVPLLRFPNMAAVKHLEGQDLIEIYTNGRFSRFPEEVALVLERVSYSPLATVQTVVDACAGAVSEDRVLAALLELERHGIVSLRNRPQDDAPLEPCPTGPEPEGGIDRQRLPHSFA
jgi:hypothetical protein